MRRKDFISDSEPELLILFFNIINVLQTHSTDPGSVYGLTQAQRQTLIDALQAAIDNINIIETKKNQLQELIDQKNVVVESGISLLRANSKIIKADPSYTEAIGDLLGIIGKEIVIDYDNAKPVIKKVTLLPDMVKIPYIKGIFDGVLVEIAVVETETNKTGGTTTIVKGGGNDPAGLSRLWSTPLRDDNPPFEDRSFNKTNQPEVRYYRFRYLKGDQPIGLYSNIIRVVAEIYPAI